MFSTEMIDVDQLLMPELFIYLRSTLERGRIEGFNSETGKYVVRDEAGKVGEVGRLDFMLSPEAEEIFVRETRIEFARAEFAFGKKFPDMSDVEFGSDPKAVAERKSRQRSFLQAALTIYKPKDIGIEFSSHLRGSKSLLTLHGFSFPKPIETAVRLVLKDLGAVIDEKRFRGIEHGKVKGEDATKRWSVGHKLVFPRPIDLSIIPERLRPLCHDLGGGMLMCQSWPFVLGAAIMLGLPIFTHVKEVKYEPLRDEDQTSIF